MRRDLKRHYKENPRPMGVYAIRNLAEGRVHLGASLDMEGALNRHRFELKLRNHRNKPLQQDWLRLGPEQFSFEVVDTLKRREDPGIDYRDELAELLAVWCEELKGERA